MHPGPRGFLTCPSQHRAAAPEQAGPAQAARTTGVCVSRAQPRRHASSTTDGVKRNLKETGGCSVGHGRLQAWGGAVGQAKRWPAGALPPTCPRASLRLPSGPPPVGAAGAVPASLGVLGRPVYSSWTGSGSHRPWLPGQRRRALLEALCTPRNPWSSPPCLLPPRPGKSPPLCPRSCRAHPSYATTSQASSLLVCVSRSLMTSSHGDRTGGDQWSNTGTGFQLSLSPQVEQFIYLLEVMGLISWFLSFRSLSSTKHRARGSPAQPTVSVSFHSLGASLERRRGLYE